MLIQIIEDDRALSEGIALALKEPSLDFVQSMTVQAAKEAFEKCMPELLILDVNLPDGSVLFTRSGREISLSVNEQRLLRLLLENRGRVLTRSVLVDRLWSDGGEYVDENALSVTVNRLRSKLEDKKDPASCIRTVYGQGYMWKRK